MHDASCSINMPAFISKITLVIWHQMSISDYFISKIVFNLEICNSCFAGFISYFSELISITKCKKNNCII